MRSMIALYLTMSCCSGLHTVGNRSSWEAATGGVWQVGDGSIARALVKKH
jgi:hypothetical protein